MAFTPTSVMIKSSEIRNFGGKIEPGEMEHNINLTPSHMQPSPARFNYRPGEVRDTVIQVNLSTIFLYFGRCRGANLKGKTRVGHIVPNLPNIRMLEIPVNRRGSVYLAQ